MDAKSDLATLLFFLHGCENAKLFFETYSATEAFDAACRLLGLDPVAVRAKLEE
jgi:hypothetical protein